MTVWPSGLRRWLKAPFRNGVGSTPTAVNHVCSVCVPQTIAVPRLKIEHFRCSACAQPGRAHTTDFCGPSCHAATPRHRAVVSKDCTLVLGPVVPGIAAACFCITNDSLAERSKAVAQGAIPKGHGFEPHSCQSCMQCVCATDDCCASS